MMASRWGFVLVAAWLAACGADEAVPVDGPAGDVAAADATDGAVDALEGPAIDATIDSLPVDAQVDATPIDAPIDAPPALAIVVSPTSVMLWDPGGPPVNATVRLTLPPPAPLTVTLVSSDPGAATVAPATLTFTAADYAVGQTVALAVVDDVDTMHEFVTVDATAPGAVAASIAVMVSDQTDAFLAVSPSLLSVDENGAGTIMVRLTAMPSFPTNVMVTSSDPGAATVAPATFTIPSADWTTPYGVTVTGVDDADLTDEAVTITVTSVGHATHVVEVTVVDDDVP